MAQPPVGVDEQSTRHTSTPKGRFVLRADSIRPYGLGRQSRRRVDILVDPYSWHMQGYTAITACFIAAINSGFVPQQPPRSSAPFWAHCFMMSEKPSLDKS